MPVDGLDVIYTINFTVHDAANVPYAIEYKVVSKGQFDYIEESLRPIGEY